MLQHQKILTHLHLARPFDKKRQKNRLRGQRRSGRKDLDDIGGSGGVSEDDIKHASDRLDELIHKHEAAIDQARASKESELLEV